MHNMHIYYHVNVYKFEYMCDYALCVEKAEIYIRVCISALCMHRMHTYACVVCMCVHVS